MEDKKKRKTLRMKEMKLSDFLPDEQSEQQAAKQNKTAKYEKTTDKTTRRKTTMPMQQMASVQEDDLTLIPMEQFDDEDKEVQSESTFVSALEEVEEEEIPDYSMKGGTLIRDGEAVDHHTLMRDYQRLKSEVGRLQELSHTLYRGTQQIDRRLTQTIRVESRRRKKLALTLTLLLGTLGLLAAATVFFIKEARQKEIMSMVKQEREEKKKITKLLDSSKEQTQQLLVSLREKHNLEKQAIQLRLEQEKKKAMEEMRHQIENRAASEKLSESERQKIFAEVENKIRDRYRQKEMSQLKILAEQIAKERQTRAKELKQITSLLAKSKTEKRTSNKITEQQQKEAESKLKETEAIKKQLETNLSESKNELTRMRQEMELLRKKLTAEATTPGTSVGKTGDASADKPVPDKTEAETTSAKVTRPPQKKPTPVPKSTYKGPGVIDLTSQYSGAEIFRAYLQQKMVETETMTAAFTSGTSRFIGKFYSKHDVVGQTSKELLKIVRPQRLSGTTVLALIDRKENERRVWKYDVVEGKLFRMPDSARTEKILASEFTYEDWMIENTNLYRYKYLQTVDLRGRKSYVVLCEPTDSDEKKASEYGKKYYWIDVQVFFPLQIKYFDKNNRLCKIFFIKKMLRVDNIYWRPASAFMINTKTRSKTQIDFTDWQINKKVSDDLFSPRSLSK